VDPTPPVPNEDGGEPCLRCGACCFSTLPTYVPVTGADHARLGDHADDLVTFEGVRAYLRIEDGHCAALRVEDDREGPRFVCSVYDVRPATCRELLRGSPACEGELATKAARPREAAARLVSLRTHRKDAAP
jgi:Fe-S-cluster containining protein